MHRELHPQPILFTSQKDDTAGGDTNSDGTNSLPGPGQWESLYIDSSTSTLANVEIRYAGNAFTPGHGGGRVGSVNIRSSSPTITNTRIFKGENDGIDITGASNPTLQTVSILNSGGYAIYQDLIANPTYLGLDLRDNGASNSILLQGGNISGNRKINAGGYPLTLTTNLSIPAESSLELVPGTVLKFPEGALFLAQGTLTASGTVDLPIIFTSVKDDTAGGDTNNDGTNSQPGPGQWESLYIDSTTSKLENVEVRYAGNAFTPGHGGGRVGAVNIRSSSPTISNTRIFKGENDGIDITGASNPILQTLSILNSGGYAIYQDLIANPAYLGLDLRDNGASNSILLQGGNISGERKINAGGYPLTLTTNLTIPAESSLELVPGTVLKFPEGALFRAQGTLTAQGTAGLPIIFTSVKDDTAGGDTNNDGANSLPGPGQWESLYIDSTTSKLENVEVRYAGNAFNPGHGGGRTGAVNIRSSNPTISNTRIVKGENDGIDITGASNPTLQTVSILSSGGYAIYQDLIANPAYLGLDLRENGASNSILLQGGTISGDRKINSGNYPFTLTSNLAVQSGSSLELVPGTVLKFPEGAFFRAEGTLTAQGTAGLPIIFTSVKDDTAGGDTNNDGTNSLPGPGQWESLYIDSSTSKLENVEVRYAGNAFNPGHGGGRTGAVNIRGSSPTITNTRIFKGENDGIDITGASNPELQNVSILNAGGYAIYQDLVANPSYLSLDLRNNGANSIQLQGGTTTGERKFNFAGYPAALTSNLAVQAGSSLELVAGTILKFPQGAYFSVQGSINATGNPSLPIIFTSVNDDSAGGDSNGDGTSSVGAPGQWESLYLYTPSTLDNVEIRYAGNAFSPGHGGGLVEALGLRANMTINNLRLLDNENSGIQIYDNASVIVNNSSIVGSGGSGIAVSSGSLTVTNSIFQGNANGVVISPQGTASGSGNAFLANRIRAVQNNSNNRDKANFEGNWWASSFGPHDPSVADGFVNDNPSGQPVSDYVNYGSWLTSPPPGLNLGPTIRSAKLNATGTAIDVVFFDPIDSATFSTEDVTISAPAGGAAPPTITSVTSTSRFAFNIELASPLPGNTLYTLRIGPNILSLGGIAMDGNQNGVQGELADAYQVTMQLDRQGPRITSITPRDVAASPWRSIDVAFDKPIDFSSLTVADVRITAPNGSSPQIIGFDQAGDSVARIRFLPQSIEGLYQIEIGPDVTDLAGTPMDQDRDGNAGESIDDVFNSSLVVDATGPRVTVSTPQGSIFEPFDFIDLTFTEAMNFTSVAPSQFTLIGPNGAVGISQVIGMGDSQFRVRFPMQTTPGRYTFSAGPNITDRAGNAMDSNQNGVFGEVADRFTSEILLGLPDLSFVSLSAPSQVNNGESFVVGYEVKNLGASINNGRWTDRLVFSKDATLGNADDIVLGNLDYNRSFATNESYTGSFNAVAPFGVTGASRLFVVVDATSRIVESLEDNNLGNRSIDVTFAKPPADLIVDTISVGSPIGRGDLIPLTFRIRNDGTAGTEASAWNDDVYLSQDNVFDTSDRFLGSVRHTGKIAAGASYTVSPNLTMPESAVIGDYYVFVRTDTSNEVVEPGAEGNNIGASDRVTVVNALLPDLDVVDVTLAASSSRVSGEAYTVNWTGTNVGSKTATGRWTDRIYLSIDPTVSSDDILVGNVEQNRTLNMGEQYTSSFNASWPEGISGNRYLIVIPDATNTIREGDGESNGPRASEAISLSLYPYADLTVTNVTAPPLIIGDPVDLTVSWTVSNVGAGPGRVSEWTDRVILSRNTTLGDSDDLVLGNFVHSGAMPTGSTYDRREIIPLAARTSGRFNLFVQTDASDVVFELPGNQPNQASPSNVVDITPTPYADLIVDSVTTSGTPKSGQPLSVSWTVSNRGIATTDTSTWTDFIYVSSDATGATGLRLIGTSTHGGALGVNQSYTRNTEVELPRDLNGINYIFVRTGGPYEFLYNDSKNQNRSDAIDVLFIPPPPVDLSITNVSLGGLTQASDSSLVEVQWTVRNDGPQATESGWTDRVFLQSIGNPNETYEMGRFSVANPLDAGKTITRKEVLTLPRVSGLFRFVIINDVNNQVIETNELNNQASSDNLQINLRARPDLRVTRVEAPASITAGTILDVAFTVTNVGTADTPTGSSRWRDRVWLSSSSSQLSGAILLGELANQSALGFPGTSTGQPTEYRSQGSYLIPRAISGNWFVLVEADANNIVDEFPSDNNNRNATAIAIDANPVPPPDLVVQRIVGPGDVFDDNNITVRYKVANLGAGETFPGAWSDQVWLTLGKDGPKPGRGDVFLGNYSHNGVLKVGEFYEAEATFRIPKGTTGQYFLTVYTDSSNRVYEAAFASNINPDAPNDLEGSNYGSTPIQVLLTPPADLQVTRVTADATGTGDRQFTVSWQVSNNGAGQTDRDVWADAVYVSQDDKWDANDQLVFAVPQPGPLAPGESYEHSATFTLPPSAAGSHILVRTNVDPRIAITEEAKFLQEVRDVLQRIETATGKPIGEIKVSDLRQFTSTELRNILAGPTNVLQTVYEGPYTNNNVGATTSSIVAAIADLKVQSVTASDAALSGDPIQVSWTVENIGTYATANDTTNFDQFIFLSKDPVFDQSRAILAKSIPHVLTQPLAPGSSYSQSAVVQTPPGSSGKWYAHVFVNVALGRYGLSFEAWGKSAFPGWVDYFSSRPYEGTTTKLNNSGSSKAIEITYAEPDLRISSFSAVPVDPNSGSFLNVSMTVINEGNRETRVNSWTDSLYFSADTSLDSYDIFLGAEAHNQKLLPGQSYSFTKQVRVPDNIGGPYFLMGATDSVLGSWVPGRDARPLPYPIEEGPARIYGGGSGAVQEFADEDDNLTRIAMDVQFVPAPDLVVDSVDAPARVELGQQFTVSYSTSNDGGAVPTTQIPYRDRVYLSRDTTLDIASDHYVGEVAQGEALGAGTSKRISKSFWLPRGLSGDFYVFVVTDIPNVSRPQGEVFEVNEDNNLQHSITPLLIVVPPPSDLQVTDVAVPSTGQVGDVVAVSWVVENRGDVPVRGRLGRRRLSVGGWRLGHWGSVPGAR